MKLRHVHHWTFDKLICAISIICLAVVLVLKDSLRTYFKSLSLSLGVRSLSLSWSLGVRSLSLSLGVRSLLTSLEESLSVVETGPSGNDFVSYAAPVDVAAPSTTRTSVEEPPIVTNSSSALASCSLLELNPPFPRRSEPLKEKEKRKTQRSLNVDSENPCCKFGTPKLRKN